MRGDDRAEGVQQQRHVLGDLVGLELLLLGRASLAIRRS